jgi:uncharacterized protein
MQSKLIFEREGLKTYALVYEKGDEVISALQAFAEEHKLGTSYFTAIGALKHVVVGFFDREKMDYLKIPIKEQVEVLSLTGNITLSEEGYKIHAHTVLRKADASTLGGHVLEAQVWPTLELIVEESPKHLRRQIDPETGLPLLDFQSE